jgi:WNK lysine deficient protein kinase
MASSHTKVGAPAGEKTIEQQLKQQQQSQQLKQQQQSQQQQIQQPISLSTEDDEISATLPQTLEQSTIVEKSPAERYIRFNEKLGSGAYKDVYRAYDTIEGIEVAWNVVKLHGVPKAERVRIVNEVRLLERLHHPNIISFHGSWVNRETERVIFVTEILSSGTLKSFVQKVQLIRWKIFKRWAIQILKGLEYLHSQDPPIIHRDLKCDNIFINGTSGDLRIGDFGLSTAISKKNQVR